ncbi:MAG: glycosyltransferase [Cyanobacteria bacterium HKST-UBA05]|nr:glycosyltransferase [Cyanobacteria bacterium HKST-UBA05]
MKILLVHNYYQQYGGEDGVFEAEQRLLADKGIDVATYAVHNHDIQSIPSKVLTTLNSVYSLPSARAFARVLDIEQPDIIHVHNFFPKLSPALYHVARQKGLPVVQTLHNFRLICPSALLLRNNHPCTDCVKLPFPWPGVVHGCYRDSSAASAVVGTTMTVNRWLGAWKSCVSKYIALSEFSKQVFLDSNLGLDPDQIVVKRNFVADQGVRLDTEAEGYIFVGRLSIEKGIGTLLEALPHMEAPLTIVGGGPLQADVEAAAAQNPHVRFLGFRPPDEVRQLVKNSRALLFPSVWYENCPLTIVESLSVGTPVVASALGAPGEMVVDEVNGLLFPPSDVAGLLAALRRLDQQPALRARLRQGARNTYEQEYAPDVSFEKLMALYSSLHRHPR